MPRAVPGHFLTLNPAFLIDLMIGHKTLACQASTEGVLGLHVAKDSKFEMLVASVDWDRLG